MVLETFSFSCDSETAPRQYMRELFWLETDDLETFSDRKVKPGFVMMTQWWGGDTVRSEQWSCLECFDQQTTLLLLPRFCNILCVEFQLSMFILLRETLKFLLWFELKPLCVDFNVIRLQRKTHLDPADGLCSYIIQSVTFVKISPRTNIYEYIRIKKITRMNVRKYSYRKFDTNECPNKYWSWKL